MKEKKITMIGLDTSHTVKFTELIQGLESSQRCVDGLRVTKALRFSSAFQSEEGQDKRQAELEAMGVIVAPTLDEAVEGADAIFLEINDPSLHLHYFEEVAPLGLPVFIDKPLAANSCQGRRIREVAEQHRIPVWSASSLRFIPELRKARETIASPIIAQTFGALGKAAAGSDLLWYGVHAVEMLTAALGMGAESVRAIEDSSGVILVVRYGDDRRGLVECLRGFGRYGGRLQSKEDVAFFDSGRGSPYPGLLNALRDFVREGTIPVPLAEAQEILGILEAGERSLASGRSEPVEQ